MVWVEEMSDAKAQSGTFVDVSFFHDNEAIIREWQELEYGEEYRQRGSVEVVFRSAPPRLHYWEITYRFEGFAALDFAVAIAAKSFDRAIGRESLIELEISPRIGDKRTHFLEAGAATSMAMRIVDVLAFSSDQECDDYRTYFQEASSSALEKALSSE